MGNIQKVFISHPMRKDPGGKEGGQELNGGLILFIGSIGVEKKHRRSYKAVTRARSLDSEKGQQEGPSSGLCHRFISAPNGQ